MIANPTTIIRNYPTEVVSVVFCLTALVYVGTAIGAAVMLAGLSVMTLLVVLLGEDWHRQAGENTDQQHMSPEGIANIAKMLNGLAFLGLGLCELFWYSGAFIPQPRFDGIVVSSPTAWMLANVSAVLAALVAYRHAPAFCRTFLTVGTAVCTLGIFLFSTIVPLLLAM